MLRYFSLVLQCNLAGRYRTKISARVFSELSTPSMRNYRRSRPEGVKGIVTVTPVSGICHLILVIASAYWPCSSIWLKFDRLYAPVRKKSRPKCLLEPHDGTLFDGNETFSPFESYLRAGTKNREGSIQPPAIVTQFAWTEPSLMSDRKPLPCTSWRRVRPGLAQKSRITPEATENSCPTRDADEWARRGSFRERPAVWPSQLHRSILHDRVFWSYRIVGIGIAPIRQRSLSENSVGIRKWEGNSPR